MKKLGGGRRDVEVEDINEEMNRWDVVSEEVNEEIIREGILLLKILVKT